MMATVHQAGRRRLGRHSKTSLVVSRCPQQQLMISPSYDEADAACHHVQLLLQRLHTAQAAQSLDCCLRHP